MPFSLDDSNKIAFSGSRKGLKHHENQDAIGVRKLSDNRVLLVIADGISSHAFGGSVARWIVDKNLMSDTIPDSVGDYLATVHERFRREFDDFDEMLTSGASLSLAAVSESHADVFWAGDSPIFHIPRSTLIAELLAEPHSNSAGALTSCFKGKGTFLPSHKRIGLSTDDILVLASDGLNADEMLLAVVESNGELHADEINALLDASVAAAESDDASVIYYVHNGLA